jgi:aerobic carbon-monoxide dehydrogenase medium subunit
VDLPIDEVVRPRTVDEALAALAEHPEARAIAGGTDLVVQLRDGRVRTRRVVDLGGLGLAGIRETGGGLEIGATTTMDEVARDPAVARSSPALAVAAGFIGAWPIQCRATLAGNLANASPAADAVPPLLVAGARVRTRSRAGEREVPLDELFVGPGRTCLAPGELILAVVLPEPLPAGGRERFVKLGPRREQVLSIVSVAVRIGAVAGGRLRGVRIALGAVAPTPLRAHRTEALLEGAAPDAATLAAAGRALVEEIAPIDDLRAPADYRRHAAAVMLRRVVEELAHG